MTETRSSGEIPLGPCGSALVADVTIAQLSSGATQTAIGGPTTLPGTSIVSLIFGGYWLTSMMLTVSGIGFGGAIRVPLSSTTVCPSFDDSTISARATAGSKLASSPAANTWPVRSSMLFSSRSFCPRVLHGLAVGRLCGAKLT